MTSAAATATNEWPKLGPGPTPNADEETFTLTDIGPPQTPQNVLPF